MVLPYYLLSLGLIASNAFVDANHCTLCYGTEESLAIPLSEAQALDDGTTCKTLGKFSQFRAETEDICLDYYQFIGFSKCGCEAPKQETVQPACGLCYDHSLPAAPEATFDSRTGTTCQEAYNYLSHFEQSDETCRSFQHLGVTSCGCPHQLPPTSECSLCDENEQLLNPNQEISGDGTTCGLMEYLLAVDYEGTYASPEICDTAKQGFREKCTCVPATPTTPNPTLSPTTSQPTPMPTPSLAEICDDILNGSTPFIPEAAQSDIGGYELNLMIASDASVGILLPLFQKEITNIISTEARGCQSRRLHAKDGSENDDTESVPIIHFTDFFDLKEKENASCSNKDIKGTRCHVVQGDFEVFYSPSKPGNNNNQGRERRLIEISVTDQILALLQQKIAENDLKIKGIQGVVYQPINDSNLDNGDSDEGKGGLSLGGNIGLSVGACAVVALAALGYGSKSKLKSLSKSRKLSFGTPTSDKEQFYHPEVYMRSDDSISNSPTIYNNGDANGAAGTTIDFLNPILVVDDDSQSSSDSELPYDERSAVEVLCTESVYSASTSQFEELYAKV